MIFLVKFFLDWFMFEATLLQVQFDLFAGAVKIAAPNKIKKSIQIDNPFLVIQLLTKATIHLDIWFSNKNRICYKLIIVEIVL